MVAGDFVRNDSLRGAVILMAGLVSWTGCGSATYDAKFDATLDEMRRETPFKELFKQPVTFPEAALSLRIPSLFGEKTYALDESEGLADPVDKKLPVDVNRIQPDFIKLPGYLRTYEHFVELTSAQGKPYERPVYCYMAVAKSKDDRADKLRQILVDKFGVYSKEDAEEAAKKKVVRRRAPKKVEQPPNGTREWQSLTMPTPDGKTIEWQKIMAVGDQHFQYYDDGVVKTKYLPGVYRLYLHQADGFDVVLAWRARTDVAARVRMEELADATAGTVQLGASEDVKSQLENL